MKSRDLNKYKARGKSRDEGQHGGRYRDSERQHLISSAQAPQARRKAAELQREKRPWWPTVCQSAEGTTAARPTFGPLTLAKLRLRKLGPETRLRTIWTKFTESGCVLAIQFRQDQRSATADIPSRSSTPPAAPECRYYPAVISPTIAAHSFPWCRHSHFVRKWQRFAVALSAVPEIPLMPERKGSCSPSAIESVHPDHSMHCESIGAKSGANCDARCTELTHGERCINRATAGRGRECRSRRCWIARNVESRERGETMAGPTGGGIPAGHAAPRATKKGKGNRPALASPGCQSPHSASCSAKLARARSIPSGSASIRAWAAALSRKRVGRTVADRLGSDPGRVAIKYVLLISSAAVRSPEQERLVSALLARWRTFRQRSVD